MAKTAYSIEDFIAQVHDDYKDFVSSVDKALVDDGYSAKIESKASGFFASYSHKKTKRSVVNLLFRKAGLVMRIYADNCDKYQNVLDGLPPSMAKILDKAPVCKRLINPEDCNPKCIMGYDFHVKENRYQKCRYSCFQFEVNQESIPHLQAFVDNERRERLA